MVDIAAVVPTHQSRHLLWRSLADWLRLRWPAVELLTVPEGGSLASGALLDAVLAGTAAEIVAFLEPGDRWPGDHLAGLAAAWQRAPGTDLAAVPTLRS